MTMLKAGTWKECLTRMPRLVLTEISATVFRGDVREIEDRGRQPYVTARQIHVLGPIMRRMTWVFGAADLAQAESCVAAATNTPQGAVLAAVDGDAVVCGAYRMALYGLRLTGDEVVSLVVLHHAV